MLQERQARLRARAAKSAGAHSSRPSLNPKDSTTSMHSMDELSHTRQKRSVGNHSLYGPAPTVPAVAYEAKTSGRESEKTVSVPAPARSARTTDPSSASTISSFSSSGSSSSAPEPVSSSSRRHKHQRSLSKEPVPLAPPLATTGMHRYQPARPSPLALAAKSAADDRSDAQRSATSPITSPTASSSRSRESSLSGLAVFGVKAGERKPDENVPKWGQKPFRSAPPIAAASVGSGSNETGNGGDSYDYHDSARRGSNDPVEQVNEDSEDDDPFEHAKYDRHRSNASTLRSSIGAGQPSKRDTVRQSQDRADMGGITEWQEGFGARGIAPENGNRDHQRGPSYPYPPSRQTQISPQYQDDGNAVYTNDPFAEPRPQGDRYGYSG